MSVFAYFCLVRVKKKMINYCTYIDMPASPFKFTYQDRILLVGSCFAENMGDKMLEYKFNVEVNPFGILYNPLSVAAACRRMLHPEAYTEEDLFFHDGRYHSFAHHGRFSDVSPGKCLSGINASLERAAALLRRSACLIVTFGTAFVYRQKGSAAVAANCHKLPESAFTRERLSVGEITAEWSALTEALRQANPSLKIILTVSPVRHRKDGAHLNQVVDVDDSLEVHQVNHPDEPVLNAYRYLNRNGSRTKALLHLRHDREEIGAHPIHLVDKRDPRNVILVGLAPDRFRLRLDAPYRAKDRNSPVQHSH